MSARRVRKSRVGLAAALVAAFLSGAAIVGAVQVAAASGSGTTYRGCLSGAGDLSKVGTKVPNCPAGSRTISWNSTGPQGPRGPQGRHARASGGSWGDGRDRAGGGPRSKRARRDRLQLLGDPLSGDRSRRLHVHGRRTSRHLARRGQSDRGGSEQGRLDGGFFDRC